MFMSRQQIATWALAIVAAVAGGLLSGFPGVIVGLGFGLMFGMLVPDDRGTPEAQDGSPASRVHVRKLAASAVAGFLVGAALEPVVQEALPLADLLRTHPRQGFWTYALHRAPLYQEERAAYVPSPGAYDDFVRGSHFVGFFLVDGKGAIEDGQVYWCFREQKTDGRRDEPSKWITTFRGRWSGQFIAIGDDEYMTFRKNMSAEEHKPSMVNLAGGSNAPHHAGMFIFDEPDAGLYQDALERRHVYGRFSLEQHNRASKGVLSTMMMYLGGESLHEEMARELCERAEALEPEILRPKK